MVRRCPAPLALLLLALLPSQAAVLTPISPGTVLAPGKSQSFAFTVTPELLKQRPALSLLARLQSPSLGGSTYAMQLLVNGEPLELDRLLNKPPETEMRTGLRLDWFGSGAWRVVYAPDFEACNREDNPACLVGGHAYDFVLDLAYLLKPGANELVVRHWEERIKSPLELREVAVVEAPAKVTSLEPPEDPNAPLKAYAPQDRSRPAYRWQVQDGGGLRVSCGKLSAGITSGFSYPNVGWNTLGRGPAAGAEASWHAVSKAAGSGVWTVEARGASYRLERSITPRPDHLVIRDRLTNLTGADLHLSLRHMIPLSPLPEAEVYVHGLRSRIRQGYDTGGDNPTVLVQSGADALGLVAEDDVFRAQSAQVATADPAQAGLLDHYFMLQPRAVYETRWSIYPVPAGGYFDFVNAVRRNWRTNFTIPGPFAFAPHPTHEAGQTPDLRTWLTNGGMRIVSTQIPMPQPGVLAHGLAFLREPAEQQRLADQARRLRRAAPGLKVLQYLHVYITRRDEAASAYPEARHLGPDGKQLTYAAGSWKPTFWLFLPTTSNAYGREMSRTFDLVLDKLGFDGVYWDELAYSAEPVAHRLHDGHTALPDLKTMTVQEPVAFTPLYCQAYQVQQARRVLDAGKILVGNGQPQTETMTRLQFPRFVEAWNAGSLRNAHLYCPLGLSSPDKVKREADLVPSICSHLENGGLWYYYCAFDAVKLTHPEATAHLFPFTPIELHAGYLIGRERILTARSGLFGWNDRSRARAYVYRPDGTLVTGFTAPRRELEGKTYTELRLPPGGLGIIERLP